MKYIMRLLMITVIAGGFGELLARKSTLGIPLIIKPLTQTEMKRIYKPLRLKELHNRPDSYTSTYKRESLFKTYKWRACFNKGPVCGLFAKEACVGMIQLKYSSNERLNHRAELYGLYVESEYINDQKVVDDLIQYALEEAHRRSTERVVIKCMRSNEWLEGIAKRNGFTLAWTEPEAVKTFKGCREDLLVYQRVLNKPELPEGCEKNG